ncbi:MAG: redoxin domain-containing protein [Pseudomonadales bacterium]|nr:redoxin domain-containing protein [Pseudomonadales bacterium]
MTIDSNNSNSNSNSNNSNSNSNSNNTIKTRLPAFSLKNIDHQAVSFPNNQPTLICFIKKDCPTCELIMPLLAAQLAANDKLLLIGQTSAGNLALHHQYSLPNSLLDDSNLKVSFAFDIEIVPTLIWANESGELVRQEEGFVRDDWQALIQAFGTQANIKWDQYPQWRVGCGSLSVDPDNADRLQAEAENSPLRARKIEIASADDEFEFMFDQGFTDGLPVVPPTPERVIRMLSGTQRDPQEIVAIVPPNMAPASVEKLAINAVLAGCKAEYLPVVIAALEAACTDEFNIHGVMATTMGASPVMVVNGPIRERIGMNMKLSALGQGNRANATIGRALRLAIRNIGGAVPGGTERPTLSNPMKFTMCFAEWQERTPWQPLHVERGFDAQDSVVTLFCMTSGPTLIVDQKSLTAPQLARSMAMSLEHVHHPKAYMSSDCLLVVCPEHLDTLMRDGHYTKQQLRQQIFEASSKPVHQLVEDDQSGMGIPAAKFAQMSEQTKNGQLTKFASADDIHIVVAGSDAGKFSGAFHGWVNGPTGSMVVSKKIQEA